MTAPIIVVSGLPRSGTSMTMQMLQAGGVPILTDSLRSADEDNPRGYLEYERVKHLKTDSAWLKDAGGKAVKVIHMLLMDLPPDLEYRVIFMRRPIAEVVRSQAKMLERSGRQGGLLTPERLQAVFGAQLAQVDAWVASRPQMQRLDVNYATAVADPLEGAQSIAHFLGLASDPRVMAAAVDRTLHRNRS